MKTINITYSEEDFKKLKREKTEEEEISKERISWEDFVFQVVCGK